MEAHSIKTWVEILGKTDATHMSAEKAIANRILGDMIGYRHNSKDRQRDCLELANAIRAYAYMMQEANLKIILD